MSVLFSKPFYHLIEHEMNGLFDTIDEVTVAPLLEFGSSVDIAGSDPESLGVAQWLDDWSTYTQLADAQVAPLTISYPVPNVLQWAIPDVVFNVGTTIDPVGGLLFYWDTGTPSTSPLIGIEVWDSFSTPVSFTSGVDFTWFAAAYLMRWTME